MLGFLKRLFGSDEAAPPARAPIEGVVCVAGRDWRVREEKRQGPFTQMLVLAAVDGTPSEMHLRPMPGSEAHHIDDIAALGETPAYRWFDDEDGVPWEARLVTPDPPTEMLIKFIARKKPVVFEGPYGHDGGLGLRTDEELRVSLRRLMDEPTSAG